MANNNIVNVDFHGQKLATAKTESGIVVAIKPICENIGLDWNAQYQRIKRHPVMNSTMCVTHTVAEDGKLREMAMLPVKMLNGWLFGVDSNRVSEEARPVLIRYQEECFDALFNYWNNGFAINPRMQYSVGPSDKLTAEQADTLRRMLNEAAAKAHPNDGKKQGVMIRAGWSKLKAHFKVSYRDIPQGEFTEAVSIVSRHVIEGEYLPKATVNAEPEPKKISPPVISEYLQAHINRKTHEVALSQYDAIRGIITEAVQGNLNCGATQEAAHDYVDTYGDAASEVIVMNKRDVFMLASQTTQLLNSAGHALETIHRLEKHLGRNLYQRKKHGEFGSFGLPESLVESVISAAQERKAA